MESQNVNRVIVYDLHAGQIQGFFDIPVDNLYAAPVFTKHIKENFTNEDLVIVSPDVGGLVRAREIAKKLGAELAIVDKRRPKAGISEVMNIIGDVDVPPIVTPVEDDTDATFEFDDENALLAYEPEVTAR